MRTLKPQSLRAMRVRKQKWLDQQYFADVTRDVMGKLEITQADLEKYPHARDFSRAAFPHVLHHIQEWNSTTLGKIAAYGLGRGETSEDIPLRRTSLEDAAWHGTLPDPEADGGYRLEWLVATTIVAAAYDFLCANAMVYHLKARARAGGREDCLIRELAFLNR